MSESPRHPKDQDWYTPITPELLDLIAKMRHELGSYAEICAAAGIRKRVLRRIYRLERKTISYTLLDKLCTTAGIGSVHEFTWFTADDLVALGVWDNVEYWNDRPEQYERKPGRSTKKAKRLRARMRQKKKRAANAARRKVAAKRRQKGVHEK